MIDKIGTEVANTLINFGALGIFVIVLGFYIYYQNKVHQMERSEWRGQSAEQFKTIVGVSENNTRVVHELKGTLESIEKRLNR